jgi:predicted kinase
MGAGKTTLSHQISQENNAIRLSEDEWLTAHYPAQINNFSDYIAFSNLIKPFVGSLVKKMLSTGNNVVMDFPANTVKQRAWLVELSNDVGAQHEMIFLNATNEKCLSQIAKRRAEQPDRNHFDTEEVFHRVTAFFEAPSIDEELNIREIV